MTMDSLGKADLNELLSNLGWPLLAKSASPGSAQKAPGDSDQAEAGTGAATEAKAVGDTAQISPRVQVRLLEIRALYEATYRVSQETGRAMGASGQSRADFNAQLAQILADRAKGLPPVEGTETPLDKLAAQFTPEATASRIFDFASSWYGQWLKGGQDTEENRQAFADYIGAAVEKGFKDAQGLLGQVPDKTQADIDRTHQLVQEKFQDFVANGLAKSSEELAAAQKSGQAFNATFSAAADDPVDLMRQVLDRLSSDGTLRLEAPPTPSVPGRNLELTA